MNKFWLASLLAGLFMLGGCSDEAAISPEAQARAWLTQMEAAVKEKQLSDIKALISEDYQDAEGNTRQKIMLRLALWFKRYDTVGLDNTVTELEATPESARLVLHTAFSQSQALAQLGLSNSQYQFVLLLAPSDNGWVLNHVTYAPLNQ